MDINQITREFNRAGEIQGTYKLKHLVKLFTELAALDKQSEKLRKRYGCLTWIAILLLIAALIGLGAIYPHLAPIVGILFLVVIVVFIVKWRTAKKTDLANDFRTFALPVLRDLSEDVAQDSKLSISIPLTPIEKNGNLKTTSDKYKKGIYHKCIDYIYSRSYIEAKIPMRDGNGLGIAGEVFLKKTKKSKWARGKHKTKVKYKKWIVFSVNLDVDPERYVCDESAFTASKRLKEKCAVRRKGGRETIRVRYMDRVDMSSSADAGASPELMIKEILGMYKMLRVRA